MKIPQKAASIERYNMLKTELRSAAQAPENAGTFSQTGDRLELSQDFTLKLDGRDVLIKSGSAFDEDIHTRDTISTETHLGGHNMEVDSFEHFSEKRGWWIFKRDQEMLKVGHGERKFTGTGAHSGHMTTTFEM